MSAVQDILHKMLAIASPTRGEQAFNAWLRPLMKDLCPHWEVKEYKDSLIFSAPEDSRPHLALVGHSDVVPAHFEPYVAEGRLHGSGASDMKGALAAFVQLLADREAELAKHYRISLIVYAREEQTPLVENGLYDLLQAYPDFLKSIDVALIGEPTDNTLQLGCVGSIHATLKVKGKACHSARPWNGENAFYKALPILQQMAAHEPVKHQVFGLDFFDVMQVTESQSEPGRTSLPGWWQGNLNFRFAPVRSESDAWEELVQWLKSCHWPTENPDYILSCLDSVPAGRVIENDAFVALMERFAALDVPKEAKQAWTDVAQLTAHGIPAFNFGPGLTAQAHTDNEHILIADLDHYLSLLTRVLIPDSQV